MPEQIKAVDPYQRKEEYRKDENQKIVFPDTTPPKTIYAPEPIPAKPVEPKKEEVKPYDPKTKLVVPI